jgi:para-aminobenzoate synthetase / 4-amino-4-deoxychorismate lyase
MSSEDRNYPEFSLLESLLCDRGELFLLDLHLKRLSGSASFFGYQCPIEKIAAELDQFARRLPEDRYKIRLLLDKNGSRTIEQEKISERPFSRVTIAEEPVDSSDIFLRHKTTNRAVYDSIKAAYTDYDDVLLINERGELTESTTANLIVRFSGKWYTPSVDCGLLPGTYRQSLINAGKLLEKIIYPDDLKEAEEIKLINSVRKEIAISVC